MAWKKIIKTKIKADFRDTLLNKIKTYKKLDYQKLKEETFETKSYLKDLNIHDGRIKYMTRVLLVPGVNYLYKNDKSFKESLWSCVFCEKYGNEYSLENYSHTLNCKYLEDLRSKRNLLVDQHLCNYIKDVMRHREEILES